MNKNIDIYYMYNKKEYTLIVEKRDIGEKRSIDQEIISFERDSLIKNEFKDVFCLSKAIECLDYLIERGKVIPGDFINFFGPTQNILREVIFSKDINDWVGLTDDQKNMLTAIQKGKLKNENLDLTLSFAGIDTREKLNKIYYKKEDYKMMKLSNIKQAKYSSKVRFANKESFRMKEIVNTSYNINQFLNNDLKEAKPTLEDNIEETVINNSLNDIKNIDIYTDGSLVWNSGGININAKGYGVVIVDRDNDNILFKIKGRVKDKTDMLDKTDLVELYAIQRACHFLNNNFNQEHLSNMNISIHTDHNDYVNIYREALKNPQSYRYPQLWDNIKKISESLNRFSIKWVKGHNNHIYNEMADKLAKSGAYFLKHEEQMVYKSIIEEKDELMNLTENIHSKNIKVRKPL